MKKTILILIVAGTVLVLNSEGKCDTIALFADTLRSSCGGPEPDYEFFFYVFHYSASGASGSRFMLADVDCVAGNIGRWHWEYAFPPTGSFFSGVEFSYGGCITGWIYLGAIIYADCCGLGGWGPCCEQKVEAHPDASSGMPEALDCSAVYQVADGLSGIININDSCPCGVLTGIVDRRNTWGSIKALYK